MNHREIRMMISALVDRELDRDGEALVRKHLASCDACAAYESEVRTLSAEIRAIPPFKLSETFPSSVLRAVRNEEAETNLWIPVESFARRFVVGLAAAVILFVGLAMTTQPEEPVVVEPYLVGEQADSSATRALLGTEALSKSDLLLAVVSRE
ncbi:MAG: zf-HC2 domain-containing protein [Ignavibacteriales bacterium]|nr:zf-HC2 domain-containing protein [Ignavibacteriales bacterium]